MSRIPALACAAALAVVAPAQLAEAQATLEYVAHAAFVVESSDGTRVAIDPYNGSRWLGYGFPDDVDADAVLVTHPHYDHDADYYFDASTPTFTEPGRYQIGDVIVTGLQGRHVDPYGTEFGQTNTIWVIDVDGVRIVHLGDNGMPRRGLLTAVTEVDVLLVPADGDDHILTATEIASIRDVWQPAVTIPMHYRLTALSGRPDSLGPIEPWLDGQSGVRRLDLDSRQAQGRDDDAATATNRVTLDRDSLPDSPEIWVLRHSPSVSPWSGALTRAWAAFDEARAFSRDESWPRHRREALEALRTAAALAPDVAAFAYELGRTLADAGQPGEAIRVLERSLAASGRHDRAFTMRSHALLARLYDDAGQTERAAAQYRLVRAGSRQIALLEEAGAFLDAERGPTPGDAPRPEPYGDPVVGWQERGLVQLRLAAGAEASHDAPTRTVEKRYVVRYPSDMRTWNGALVMGVHGGTGGQSVDRDGAVIGTAEQALDDVIADFALREGFAYASVDRDGVGASAAGVEIVDRFAAHARRRLEDVAGRPVERTYLAGLSMGGGITRLMIEEPGPGYDGAIIIAGAGGDLPTRLDRTAVMARLWSEVDPRIESPLPDDHPSVREYARAVGTPVAARVFWPFTGASATADNLRRSLASHGLTGLSDAELRSFRFEAQPANSPFVQRVAAANTTGRPMVPTIEVVGTHDDLVIREVRAYRGKVERQASEAATAGHRLYEVDGAWHIAGEDDAAGLFQYRAGQMGLGAAIQAAMGEAPSYIPAVQDALILLDRWVTEGVDPPAGRTVAAGAGLLP